MGDGGQAAAWNGEKGSAWVEMAPVLDALFEPVGERLADAVARAVPDGPGRVLDIGCGTGATTAAIARRLAPRGMCTGVDVSQPMIDAARARADVQGLPVEFLVADAGRHPFPAGGADVVASRFGVMFFDDPVAAFTSLRRATREGGALRAVVWRSAEENPFMTTAQRAAAPVLDVPAPAPGEPGQFACADEDRVLGLLGEAGWRDATMDAVDVGCVMPERHLTPYLTHMGLLGRALAERDGATRERVVATVRPAFDEYVHGDEVRITAACWLVAARA